MRIGLDVSQTCVEIGGCGWISQQLAEAMIKLANPDLEVVLYHHFGQWINSDTQSGFHSDQPSVSSPLLNVAREDARILWHNINKGTSAMPGAPEIIHSHNFSAPNTSEIPLVFTVHDLAFWDIPEASTEANRLHCQDGILEAFGNAKAFVFPSKFTESRFLDFFEENLRRKKLLHTVIPWAGRFAMADQPKNFELESPWLFVGSLDPRKNVRKLLQAFERYWEKSDQKRKLLIAGPKGCKSEFEISHIESLTKRGWAKHLGYLDDSELKSLYRKSFALVWPSFYEGFGLPVVEAMSQGTPVITSHLASIPEVGGAAAVYCDPHSVDSIADAMFRLEDNESQYLTLSKDSLQQSQTFSWHRAALELLDFYKVVLSSDQVS